MDPVTEQLLSLPEWPQLLRVSVRLSLAVLLGALLGLERERERKAAGLRTHMLVALGAALFTVAPLESGMSVADLSRVFQGVAAGIGFLGAGTILKLSDEREIRGLTTAATIWLTGAVGVAVGLGRVWVAIFGTLMALTILFIIGYIEHRLESGRRRESN
jgi:putative Mg2+ transporter-C (MgtC) family protein